MPRKLRSPKARIELTPAQLFELCTGISVHPDHFILDDDEMVCAWRDYEDAIRAYRDQFYPKREIWIEGQQCHAK